jgi:hypothetical protein
LIALEKIAQWEKQKALVRDSVSSPITKRVNNMALNEFMAWFRQARFAFKFIEPGNLVKRDPSLALASTPRFEYSFQLLLNSSPQTKIVAGIIRIRVASGRNRMMVPLIV